LYVTEEGKEEGSRLFGWIIIGALVLIGAVLGRYLHAPSEIAAGHFAPAHVQQEK
jgi:hypothetical protein